MFEQNTKKKKESAAESAWHGQAQFDASRRRMKGLKKYFRDKYEDTNYNREEWGRARYEISDLICYSSQEGKGK